MGVSSSSPLPPSTSTGPPREGGAAASINRDDRAGPGRVSSGEFQDDGWIGEWLRLSTLALEQQRQQWREKTTVGDANADAGMRVLIGLCFPTQYVGPSVYSPLKAALMRDVYGPKWFELHHDTQTLLVPLEVPKAKALELPKARLSMLVARADCRKHVAAAARTVGRSLRGLDAASWCRIVQSCRSFGLADEAEAALQAATADLLRDPKTSPSALALLYQAF